MLDRSYIIGLGNPGPQYVGTPHNLGFRVVDFLAREFDLTWDPLHAGCRTAFGLINQHPVVLVQPALYMNRSGETLLNWARHDSRVRCTETGWPNFVPLVICDDISLPLGSLRLRAQGRDGGHKGLASIMAAGWDTAYPRLRLGVAPREAELQPEEWTDFVLTDFSDEDWSLSEDLVTYAAEAVAHYLAFGLATAAGRFNRREFPGID